MNAKRIIPLALAAMLFLLLSQKAAGQQLAVKTNALSWCTLTPDIGIEVVTGERSSVALSAFGHIPLRANSTFAVVQPEWRFWFNGRPLTREYAGICGIAAAYDMAMGPNVYVGNAIGAGISGGYSFTLGSRLNLDLSAGVGLVAFRQKEYRKSDRYEEYYHGSTSEVTNWGYKIFPVKLAVTLVYIIL